jgi:hypothetical protein
MAEKENEAQGFLAASRIFEPGRLVMDPAMLKLLPVEKLRDISVIAMKANVSATETMLKAQKQIIEELQKMKM